MRNLKKVLALVLAMAMSLSLVVTAGAAYTDGDKITDKYATAVEFASQTGILEGFEDGSYGPQKNLTRAQLATMTYRIATGDVEDVYTANFAGGAAESFTDTAADAWYAGYVGYAADAGYLKGCGEGLYKPASAMTGYQALAAFLRTIGYNQPGQFTGADWTVQVAMIANDIGALEGIKGVDLNAAISREVAAQIIYNIMFSDLVSYTPALGYQNALLKDDLATEIFDIVSDKDGKVANVAPWGRLATQWYTSDKEDNVAVSIAYAPVAEFTTAVTECDMTTAIGEDDDWTAEVWKNGALTTKGNNNVTIDATKRTGSAIDTDQGTLVEVYAYENAAGDVCYEIVEIETWLGQCIDTKDAKYDKAGHLVDEATATFNIWTATNPSKVTLETADFAEDDYVLVNESKWPGEDGGYFLTPTAPVATAELKSFNKTAEQSVIGSTYDWAAKYFLGNTGSVGTEYDVFVDEYNNLIGLVKPAAADPVYTILESGVKVTTGYDSHYEAEIVDLTDGSLDRITVDSYVNQSGANQIVNWKTDTEMAPYYEHNIVSYVEGDDGYELKDAADVWGNGGKLVNGEPRIYIGGAVKAVADAETVYAVETECGEYEIYTGYANVPSIDKAGWVEVLLGDDNYADLVYIDATNAIYAGSEVYVYVMPCAADIGDGDGYDIVGDIVINGEVTTVNVAPAFTAELVKLASKGVELKIDADGLVYGYNDIQYTEYKVAEDSHDEVVYLTKETAAAQGYVVDTASMIWVVDNAHPNCDAEIGDASDFEKGATVYAVLDGKVVEKAIVFKAIEQ